MRVQICAACGRENDYDERHGVPIACYHCRGLLTNPDQGGSGMTPDEIASLLQDCDLLAPAGDATTTRLNSVPILRVVKAARAYAEMASAPPSQEGWQPIETAPKDGTPIMVASAARGGVWIAQYCDRYQSGFRPDNPWFNMMLNCRWHANRDVELLPTCWRPLPPAPEATP